MMLPICEHWTIDTMEFWILHNQINLIMFINNKYVDNRYVIVLFIYWICKMQFIDFSLHQFTLIIIIFEYVMINIIAYDFSS